MKLTVYSLITEFHDEPLNTQLFTSLEPYKARLREIITDRIDSSGFDWSEHERGVIADIRELLEKGQVLEAFDVFYSTSINHSEDYIYREEHEVEFALVDALVEAAFEVERRTSSIRYPDGGTGRMDTAKTVPEDTLKGLHDAAAAVAVPE